MGEGSSGVDLSMGYVAWGPSGGTSGVAVLTWQSGPSGVYALAEGKRTSRRRVEIRHKSLTISGQIRAPERATESELEDLDLFPRPATRGECKTAERPCPYVSCKHHLYIEVNPVTGSVQFPFGALGIDEVPYTCSIDAAEDGPLTLEEIGNVMNRTKERVRQLETRALVLMRSRGGSTMIAAMDDWLEFK